MSGFRRNIEDGFCVPRSASQEIEWEETSDGSDEDEAIIIRRLNTPLRKQAFKKNSSVQGRNVLSSGRRSTKVDLNPRSLKYSESNPSSSYGFNRDALPNHEKSLSIKPLLSGEPIQNIETELELINESSASYSPPSPIITKSIKKLSSAKHCLKTPFSNIPSSPILSRLSTETPAPSFKLDDPVTSPILRSCRRSRNPVGKRKLFQYTSSIDSSSDSETMNRSDKRRFSTPEKNVIEIIPTSPCSPSTPASQKIETDEEFDTPCLTEKNKTPNIYRSLLDDEESSLGTPSDSIYSVESGVSPMLWTQSPIPGCIGRFSGQPLTPVERDLLEEIKKSNKKRKPVKQGLAIQLEKTIKMRRSMRVIHEHEMNLLNLKSTKYMELNVSRVEVIGTVVSVQGVQDSGSLCRFYIHLEFCNKPVAPGYRIRILNPFTELKVEDQNILVGVNEWENITTGELEKSDKPLTEPSDPSNTDLTEKVSKPLVHDLRCECQKVEGDEHFCDSSEEYENLVSFEKLSVQSLNRRFSSEITIEPHRKGKERTVKSVLELVDRFGVSSSSPQAGSLNTRFPILVLRILQPVLRMRTVGNPLYDETWLETETGFLAEDNQGNFLLVKLDSDVKDAPMEWLPMLDGDWADFIGSTVKISGLFPHTRTVRNKCSRLYQLVSGIRKPKQRFYYTLKVYPCSRMKILEKSLKAPVLLRPDQLKTEPCDKGRRLNLECVLVFKDKMNMKVYVHNGFYSDIQAYPLHSIKYTQETFLPCSGSGMIHLYGVWFENGELFLDHYSGYVQIQSEERFPYKDILRPTDQAYTEGELVRVVGQVSGVNEGESVEWVSCEDCKGEEIHPQEMECIKCHSSNLRNNLNLVVQVAGVWITLQENTARRVLGRDKTSQEQDGEMLNPEEDKEKLNPETEEEEMRAQDIFGKELDIICLYSNDALKEISS